MDYEDLNDVIDMLDEEESNGRVQDLSDQHPNDIEPADLFEKINNERRIIQTPFGELDEDDYYNIIGDNKPSLYDEVAGDINATVVSDDPYEEKMPTQSTYMSKKVKLLGKLNSERLGVLDEMKSRSGKSSGGKRKKKGEASAYDDFFGEENSNQQANKKDDDPRKMYEDRFNPRLSELESLTDEVGEFTDMLVNSVKEMYNSKAKGSFKAISDSATTVSSLLSTKLSIIDKKTTITKNIEELVLKNQKATGNTGTDNTFVIDQLMTKLMGKGGMSSNPADLDDAINLLNNVDYDTQVNATINSVNDLEAGGSISFSAAENALKYESLNPTIYVVANPSDRTWDFVALTSNDDEIDDYPLPAKNLAKMDIDWDFGQFAKDKNTGISYPLILRQY